MIFIDSNIWCYYFDKRLPEHHLVRDPIRQVLTSSKEIVCNTIIVMEIAHYLVRHFSEEDAKKKIELFVNLRNMRILDFNQKTMTESIEHLLNYSYSHGLGGRDSTIISSMNSQNIKTLMSHDEAFKRVSNQLRLNVVDPIQQKQE